MTIIWVPEVDPEKMADLLGCPVYSDRTPAVELAWEAFLAEMRYRLATQVGAFNMAVPGDPTTDQRRYWEIWHTQPEMARESCANLPVYRLASHQDGLGDEFLGKPGHAPGIRANDLECSVGLLSALFGKDPFRVDSYLPDPDQAAFLRADHTPQELCDLAENLRRRYCQVVGDVALDRLVNRDLDGEEREQAFAAALYWEHEVEWPVVLQLPEKPVAMLRAFDAAIVAAGFIRWCRFWSERGIRIHAAGVSADLDLPAE